MIRLDGTVIRLQGHCPVEDAEPLLEALQADATALLDLGACQSAHTAVLQLLLASRTRVTVPAADGLLASLLPAAQAGPARAMQEIG